MATINGSLVGFPPLQSQALKGTFVSLTGTQTIAGAKTFSGAVTFSSTLGVTGAATLSSTLDVTGATTVGSTLAVTGAVTPTGGVAAAAGFSAAPRALHSQGQKAVVSTDGNNSTPSTTETYITSMFVPCNMTITGVNLFNGSDVTGNVTVALATSAGAPIAAAKSATTAGSGTDAYQKVPFAAPYAAKGPANYLVCVQYDSATARYNTHTIGTDPCITQTGTTYGTIPTITPLPTVFVTNIGNIMSFY